MNGKHLFSPGPTLVYTFGRGGQGYIARVLSTNTAGRATGTCIKKIGEGYSSAMEEELLVFWTVLFKAVSAFAALWVFLVVLVGVHEALRTCCQKRRSC